MKKEIIIYLATLLISVIMMLVGLFTNLYPVEEALNPLVSLVVSIFVVIIGERIANFYREENKLRKFENKLPPNLTGIEQFNNLDDALNYLSSKIPTAEIIYNTRIEKKNEKQRAVRDSENKYDNIIKKAILEKDIELQEVVSTRFKRSASERLKLTIESGTYNVKYIDIIPPSFLNFTILDYGNNSREILIGWATSGLKSELHQPTFKIKDTRVVDYFQQIFDAMFFYGKEIKSDEEDVS